VKFLGRLTYDVIAKMKVDSGVKSQPQIANCTHPEALHFLDALVGLYATIVL